MIQKYKRKGFVEAVQYTGDNREEIEQFTAGQFKETGSFIGVKVSGGRFFILDVGGWVYRDEDHHLEYYSGDYFLRYFELVTE